MPVDNFHLPPIPPLPPPPPAATPSATSQHVLEPSEPQLLTNWRLDLIWNVQITNIIKDEQRQLSQLSTVRG